ncbi:16S rRNA (cytosine(967)-C(5))-methyltransferase RsmB [Aestuariibacter halophilus]|uniref:16S rRNA (cytosine(967)-C(5))-methyltransferase n=1 Tax=Fluctibacter halophilus TaxID=226011 RepID=A0ABS8G8P0_9ALTE|nr:16S rRNA (cytosine(967)-C(5))-methyltransferase RsmB [Aestuariibacter halophilus]MCC2616898.1 16S rRNA (cytosine(967)-C(5))-methyltransferase RsmB [Aestuariibacter halophilus]
MSHQNLPPSRLRADAARALFAILEQGRSARDVLPNLQKPYADKDKAWIQEMVYGALRQVPLLQHWLRQLLDKPLKQKAKVVEHLILIGLYQLAFSRVSTHAAVSETVNATKHLQAPGLKGLVNAVLRTFIRTEMASQLPQDAHILAGLPKWLYKTLDTAYPEQLDAILAAMTQRAPVWLRVNRQRCSLDNLCKAFDKHKVDYQTSAQHPDALILSRSGDVTQLPGFEDGWFSVQDGAAQLAAQYLAPAPGERILDCCAAPGGKTGHILERQPQLAACIALDVDGARIARIEENLSRLGHQATMVCADATQSTWWDGVLFDRILLDAPCSATGVIRRHPDIRWLRKASDIEQLVTLQAKILDTLWPMLKPGGTLLYATCSLLPQENSQQILSFLSRTADAEWQPLSDGEAAQQPGRQILPAEQQMDGFYYARLLKSPTIDNKTR